MCLQDLAEKKSVQNNHITINGRKKIWQLEASFHCSVIGTCLTLTELNRLSKKLKISIKAELSDYDWHHSFVSVAGKNSYAAKYLNKYLDKKYKTAIKQAQNLSQKEMEQLWDAAIQQDQLPATYWALLTHPLTSAQLIDRMYGEVHMLSHLSGASVRINMERLKRLEVEKLSYDKTLTTMQHETNKKSELKSNIILDLKRRVQQAERLRLDLRKSEKVIEEYKSCKSLVTLQHRLAEVEKKLFTKTNESLKAEAQIEEWRALAMKCGNQLGTLKSDYAQMQQEHSTMEQNLLEMLQKKCASCDGETQCANKDLNGNCILYVGGKDRLNAYFRALVEDQNGEFIYHDGGLNDGRQRLSSLLPKADMVFCPKDCISHEAVNKLKKFFKRSGKPLIMLRRASLAAFSKGLSEAVI
ncbi:MAG: DUF2325 domain-containing protein [Gammaproteobacteria bacterium]